MEIYVVQGSTGEYSDHREWAIKAFVSEESAKAFVLKVSARYREIEQLRETDASNEIYWPWDDTDPSHKNEFDSQMKTDYTGTNYTYFPVELVEN